MPYCRRERGVVRARVFMATTTATAAYRTCLHATVAMRDRHGGRLQPSMSLPLHEPLKSRSRGTSLRRQ